MHFFSSYIFQANSFAAQAYEAINQRWRGHKSARRSVPRTRHCVFSGAMISPIDTRHPSALFTDKALERVVTRDSALNERDAATTVWTAMKAKIKIGMGTKLKKKMTRKKTILRTKKWILPMALLFLPMLSALGSLIGGAASIVKAAPNDSKAAWRQLEELQRHDRAMEQDRGLYLVP